MIDKTKAIATPGRDCDRLLCNPIDEVIHMITQEVFDNQSLAQSEFEEYVEELADAVAPEIEIDSVPDDLGEMYRVWYGSQLLGTFYQNFEGKWVAQPCNRDERPCCNTPELAQIFIVAVNGLLVADVA
ncbi:hypothetical protein [Nostoc sp. 'Peltigera malacea cyanobiont' DB3992]|uniref:hypothetical protein n=1 Tax=Nostoc sp. 'Peltigera malacea cyanobiont' DB3992 TaxID=1206980 RepID=UPI00211DBA4B|nr:hypothetical protein [Nostoc sp. 'Peltigera malacea cyanobiont' DB3992]